METPEKCPLCGSEIIEFLTERQCANIQNCEWEELQDRSVLPDICIGFDGVIHENVTPFTAPDVIPDPPTLGAFLWLEGLNTRYNITIYSCRLNDQEGARAMEAWFRKWDFPERLLEAFRFLGKPNAILYIDDRAFRFEGVIPSLAELAELHKTWTQPAEAWRRYDGPEEQDREDGGEGGAQREEVQVRAGAGKSERPQG